MESLAEFNKKRATEHRDAYLKQAKLEIACPKCGAPLYDVVPFIRITTDYPPLRRVRCIAGSDYDLRTEKPATPCRFEGTRVE